MKCIRNQILWHRMCIERFPSKGLSVTWISNHIKICWLPFHWMPISKPNAFHTHCNTGYPHIHRWNNLTVLHSKQPRMIMFGKLDDFKCISLYSIYAMHSISANAQFKMPTTSVLNSIGCIMFFVEEAGTKKQRSESVKRFSTGGIIEYWATSELPYKCLLRSWICTLYLQKHLLHLRMGKCSVDNTHCGNLFKCNQFSIFIRPLRFGRSV